MKLRKKKPKEIKQPFDESQKEISRIFKFILCGILFIVVIQPLIYYLRIPGRLGIPSIQDKAVNTWLIENYIPGSGVLLIVCVTSTFLWYRLAAKAKVGGRKDNNKLNNYKRGWQIILLVNALCLVLATWIFNQSSDARPTLVTFYICDVVLLFWLPTATSTPGNLKYTPLLSNILRQIIRV